LRIEVEHVREMARIMEYPVLGSPAWVVDVAVKVSGRLPSQNELAGWLRGHRASRRRAGQSVPAGGVKEVGW
jgi:hypothetical protein